MQNIQELDQLLIQHGACGESLAWVRESGNTLRSVINASTHEQAGWFAWAIRKIPEFAVFQPFFDDYHDQYRDIYFTRSQAFMRLSAEHDKKKTELHNRWLIDTTNIGREHESAVKEFDVAHKKNTSQIDASCNQQKADLYTAYRESKIPMTEHYRESMASISERQRQMIATENAVYERRIAPYLVEYRAKMKPVTQFYESEVGKLNEWFKSETQRIKSEAESQLVPHWESFKNKVLFFILDK